MFMDIHLTARLIYVEDSIAYLKNNVEVISEIIDVVPYAKSNTNFLLNKTDLEKLLKNLKTKRDKLLSITRNKSQEEKLKNIEEGIEALQLLSDNFDFEKNFLYVFYE